MQFSFATKIEQHRSAMNEPRWRELCEAIMRETDAGRLLRLVEALNNELGQREGDLKHVHSHLDTHQDEES
ncbi:MAG: hypothetical protein DMG90_15700 [Acidobacteria bacterium]|jgi:hypothetical protein|nr:MAG: hypothetical protein DMG90_15700 [Acidobacteriota bacterium]